MSSYALTVRQPWADLIVLGVKDVENRTWPVPRLIEVTPGRHRSGASRFPFRLGIHAAKTPEKKARSAWRVRAASTSDEVALGALLGFVTVAGCHYADECEGWYARPPGRARPGYCSVMAFPNQWHWVLTAPEPLETPIPMRGAQRLWRLPEDL